MDLYSLLRPILFALDAERAHELTLAVAAFIARHPSLTSVAELLYGLPSDPEAGVDLFGLEFPSPVGLAAGLDKNGVAIDFWAALGFGFVEVGTVTPGAGQPGNDRPRLERIVEDNAIVNRMGFNNLGAPRLAERLANRRTEIPVGANIGKAKATPLERASDDYVAALEDVFPVADYVVINVSSPNTPNLRDLQAIRSLEPLLDRVLERNRELARDRAQEPRPILLKIAPDLSDEDIDDVASLARSMKLDGLVATNTTLQRDHLSRPPSIEGGVSGAPLKARALEVVKRLHRCVPEMPIIGVGGIESAEDARERMRAGASLVQIYSSFIFGGPSTPSTIARELRNRSSRHSDG